MGQLNSKSADLNWKVEDAEKDVGDLKCGFSTLKDDVAVLESSKFELLAAVELHLTNMLSSPTHRS